MYLDHDSEEPSKHDDCLNNVCPHDTFHATLEEQPPPITISSVFLAEMIAYQASLSTTVILLD
jgi:hypothetical protein